ncbi:MAG: histidine triad nucleotide-binding protein [Alphaproteobacteria bacterium GWF2_58_20]|nr:MAG: histidine triad nucleotide-binding protein [Alphaproteobacteria bacterium GWF2_58_20]
MKEIYDSSNVFARILRGEIPCNKVFEDAHVLAFHDIHPQAPVHVVIIPKGPYINMTDMAARATDAEMVALFRAVRTIALDMELGEKGYRILSNCGRHGGQEVPHMHLHLFGGQKLGPMLAH